MRSRRRLAALLPRLSETERQALEAGTVWVDGELFSGRPDLRRLAALPYPALREDEAAFLAGPVAEVCAMVDPWEVQQAGELPAEVWELLRRHRFFGLLLPPEHGGLGFSSLGASSVFATLASRSLGLSAVVLIPNSVGPGELLLHYGTPEQREHYLPRLARGDEIPCFALTEPGAGSDAAALRSRGEVYPGEDGQPWLRLDFDKRYITLAPVATLIGLAFQLEDPDELLGRGPAPGITCALVPAATPGVEIGARHDPLGVPFPNGPVRGRDVRVPASQIIGGAVGAGAGWRMLMEALAAGRAVSLPAQSAGGAKQVARIAGAYAGVRRQFGLPVARFDGVAERLARIGGLAYASEAARVLTCGAVDAGERPAVVGALAKLTLTERLREVVLDAMDVVGGAAIMRGPRNLLAAAWHGVPIGITVEGANILTRTLIVFGQGMLRSHRYALREVKAAEAGRYGELLGLVLRHLGAWAANGGRAALLGLTRGRLARSPVGGPLAPYWRRLAWGSARFAFWADLALFALGSRLKREGILSGRFADALGWLYLALATLRRWEAEGRREEDLPLARWALDHSMAGLQQAHLGILEAFPGGPAGWLARGPAMLAARLAPIGRAPRPGHDRAVAAALTTPGPTRDRLVAGTFVAGAADEPLPRLEDALRLAHRAADAFRALREAGLPADPAGVARAGEVGALDDDQAAALLDALAAAEEVLAVDEVEPSVTRVHPASGVAAP